jgi:hypothetical protein
MALKEPTAHKEHFSEASTGEKDPATQERHVVRLLTGFE